MMCDYDRKPHERHNERRNERSLVAALGSRLLPSAAFEGVGERRGTRRRRGAEAETLRMEEGGNM